MTHEQQLDTTNKYLVGVRGDQIVLVNPPRSAISKADALMLAAWLVVLSGYEVDEFRTVFDAVRNI